MNALEFPAARDARLKLLCLKFSPEDWTYLERMLAQAEEKIPGLDMHMMVSAILRDVISQHRQSAEGMIK